MPTLTITAQDPFVLTVEGEVNDAGETVVDLTAASPGGGALMAANNLSDLDDAAAALTNLGAGAAGAAVFAAATTPDAQAALGAGTAGSAVFIAATGDDALTAINAMKNDLSNGSALSLGDYADDAAASAGGVPVGGFYRTGSVVKINATI
jgi:hypothetical protein